MNKYFILGDKFRNNVGSWSEMGKYDVPASIDYVLNTTHHERLYYIGFSMGTTVFFTMMNHRPQYNDKVIIRKNVDYIRSPFKKREKFEKLHRIVVF